ncbi:MAG: hypothetical protein GW859_05285 [Sphingomonadales bacterium]|nr:hypothetical protein [Sphingomonadales bacterium]
MVADLQELRERLNWARAEAERLPAEIEHYATSKIIWKFETRNDAPGFLLTATCKSDIPVAIRARAGTTVNEIRSCLDGLASVLAERNQRTANGVSFPISKTESQFLEKRSQEKIRKLSDDDKLAIAALKPYAVDSKGEPGNVLLWGLHSADVRRKHQRLLVAAQNNKMMFGNGYIDEMRFLGNTVKLGRNEIATTGPLFSSSVYFPADITYAEPDVLRGRSVVKTLHEFADLVDSIILIFS